MKKQSVSENLVYYRKLKGYTQDQLSEKTTVAVRTIQRIEKGEVQPHLQTVKLLAIALEVEVNDLILIDNPKEETIQRKWMLLLHATPLLGLIIPFANIFIPTFLWIHKAEDNKVYEEHGRAVVNFHSTVTLVFILSFLAFFLFPGYNFFLSGTVFLYGLIITFYNISRALTRGTYFYPLSIPFIRPKS
ncbi:MAG: DUF4870 domain-containing protein [bacterium]